MLETKEQSMWASSAVVAMVSGGNALLKVKKESSSNDSPLKLTSETGTHLQFLCVKVEQCLIAATPNILCVIIRKNCMTRCLMWY